HPHWKERGAVSPWIHLAVGLFVSVLGIFSVCGNLLVVWTCTRFKDLRTRSNILIINLAIGDLLMCCIDFPLMAGASFLHTWPYGQIVCQLYAWITAVAGLVTINTLAAIAVDRYWAVVRRATPEQRLSKRVTGLVVLVVWTYSIAWALCPIFGWGDYVLDGIGTTCTFDYLTRTWWNRSFVMAMAAGNFLLPFSLMVFCYTRIWAAVREVKRGLESDFSQTTKGGGRGANSNAGKDRRPSCLSSGSTVNRDSGISIYSRGSTNSSRTSRSSGLSMGSINCGGGGKDMKLFFSSNRFICQHRLEGQGKIRTLSESNAGESEEAYGVSRLAFKSCRAMNTLDKHCGVVHQDLLEKDTRSALCACQHGRYWQKSRPLPQRALRSFHNCCSVCCHRQTPTNSPRFPRVCSDATEESLISQGGRSSGDTICTGDLRCGGSSTSSSERYRAKIKQRHHRLNCEHKTLRIILFLLLAFTIAWCPYLAVSLVGLFGDHTRISYLTSVLPSLVAKTSIVTNPILYSISHPKVRKRILTSILCPSHLSRPTYHVRMRTNPSSFGVSNS
ncbi:hypothetical protein EGW08_015707, partial [Elysia chlorotica]